MTIKQQQHFSFTSNDDFEKNACNYIITAANESIQRKDTFSLVLCGGRTPKNIFIKLKTENTDWSKWNIFFGDERCLPENDDDRNSSMAKKNFLNSVPIPKNQIFFIKAELGNIIAANQYNSLLENKDFDLKILQSTWNLLFKSNEAISSSLEKVMTGELDLSSSKLCGFLKESISKARRGPMPVVNL